MNDDTPIACYAHVVGAGTIPTRENLPERPVASCEECGCFTCAQHGLYEPTWPRFVCVLCIPTLTAQTSLINSGLLSTDPTEMPYWANGTTFPFEIKPGHPSFYWIYESEEEDSVTAAPESSIAGVATKDMDSDTSGAIDAAISMIRQLNIPHDHVSELLRPLLEEDGP